jgi:phytoene synthase
LLHAGITSFDPLKVVSEPALPKVCGALVERARTHFQKADEVMDRNPRRVVRAPRIMSKYYRAILELLVARGFALPRTPVRLNKMARLAIVLRYAFI